MAKAAPPAFAEADNSLRETLAATGLAGSWHWDIRNARLFGDSRFAVLHNLDPGAAIRGLPTHEFFTSIHPDDRIRMRLAIAGMTEGAEVFSKEYRVNSADGLTRWVLAKGRAQFDANDAPVRFSGILLDITERKRAEEQLRIAQTAGGIGTFEHVEGFATVTVSEQFCQLLGLHAGGAMPIQTINRLVIPPCPPLIEAVSDADVGPSTPSEFAISRADTGERRWLARRGEYVRDADTAGLRHVGVIYDITKTKRIEERLRELNDTLESRVEQEIRERQRAEEALRHSQKMDAMGQLTGGIAHDFNNLLTIIIGNIDTVSRRLADQCDPKIGRSLDNAQRGAQRAASLTQRLLAFSRRQPLAPKPVNVARLLASVTDLLGRTLGEMVTIDTKVAPDLWRVEVDPHQLENALVNLAVNARDAMPDGGALTLTAENHVFDSGRAGSTDSPPAGSFVEITVADTGTGMSEDVIARAFDPFFTTKEVGKGTGLGLSMVYGFLKQSGGYVRIESQVGSGTAIRLYVPRLLSDEEHVGPSPADGIKRGSSAETILVVEDDDDVRHYTSETLRELGYRVVEAGDGQTAIDMVDKGEPIHMIVTDIVMPTMSGREVADAIRALRPGVPVLYISGYPRDVISQGDRIDPDVDLLSKPFSFSTLSAKVREILDAAKATREPD